MCQTDLTLKPQIDAQHQHHIFVSPGVIRRVSADRYIQIRMRDLDPCHSPPKWIFSPEVLDASVSGARKVFKGRSNIPSLPPPLK